LSTRNFRYFCVHAHFYQPPRGNVITGHIGEEPDAGKYRNWNERITAQSYRPNADIGNFDHISFDVGEPLMMWLERRATETYHRIVQAHKKNLQRARVGNALASTMHHVMLPLAKPREKHTEIFWGKAAYKHHFGYEPMGFWLPEMGVDIETLRALREEGYQYTILSQGQVESGVDGSGPYWVDLEDGDRIAVFIRNDDLSNDLSFRISEAGGAGFWARNKLSTKNVALGGLALVAVNGETFGYHHLGEEQFLHWLLTHEAKAMGYKVTTLNEYIRDFPPREVIRIKPYTTWTRYNDVSRWLTGAINHQTDGWWRATLRRALDNITLELDEVMRDYARSCGLDPHLLRDNYVHVHLGDMTGSALIAEYLPGATSEQEKTLLCLLEAEMVMAPSRITTTFFADDLGAPEVYYAISSLAYAVHLAEQATGRALSRQLRNDLTLVRSPRTGVTGLQLYDTILANYNHFQPEAPTQEIAAQDPDAFPEAPMVVSSDGSKPSEDANAAS
jgi:alpha-amylase/alpha-mannosidase (GH57 family)